MRLFVAIAVAAEVRETIDRLRAPLMARAPRAHWARPESWHWTLQFLGERPEAAVPALTAALAQVRQPAFTLELRGLGGFPARGRLRTLWIGLADPAPMTAAAQAVGQALAALGLAPEERPYAPHLTLARAGAGGDELDPLRAALSLREPVWGGQRAEAFTLFWSQPRQGRFQYVPLAGFPLGG